MRIIPTKPTKTANHLYKPTFSFNKKIENMVVNIGAAKVILTTVAKGKFLKAINIAIKAIKPDVVENYWDLSKKGQLKFVANGTKECWEEIEYVIRLFRARGINYPIWIMPIGATEETQKQLALTINKCNKFLSLQKNQNQ